MTIITGSISNNNSQKWYRPHSKAFTPICSWESIPLGGKSDIVHRSHSWPAGPAGLTEQVGLEDPAPYWLLMRVSGPVGSTLPGRSHLIFTTASWEWFLFVLSLFYRWEGWGRKSKKSPCGDIARSGGAEPGCKPRQQTSGSRPGLRLGEGKWGTPQIQRAPLKPQ